MQRKVIHISAGTPSNPLSSSDLDHLAKSLESGTPVIPRGAQASSYSIDYENETFVLKAGLNDWIPSEAEMRALSEAFDKVAKTGGYIVTRRGVYASVLPTPNIVPLQPAKVHPVYRPQE